MINVICLLSCHDNNLFEFSNEKYEKKLDRSKN